MCNNKLWIGIEICISRFTFAKKIFRLLNKLLLFFCLLACAPSIVRAQKTDSIPAQKTDSISEQKKDSVLLQRDSLQHTVISTPVNQNRDAIDSVLKQNIFLNSTGTPVSMIVKPKMTRSNDLIFYILAGLILCMGLIRLYFSRYFTNLFRVFFNTSLRQSQLADQLLQAKLPSLFFNAFFMISGGIYIYILLQQYHLIDQGYKWILMGGCIVILGLVYLLKFSSLKFTGWVTGYKEATDSYIFIIFMICKIMGIILIPFTVLMAFAEVSIATVSALMSLLIIGFLLLLRFFRSYGLLQNQLKVSRFHFLLYIVGVEIIPLLLIYKALLVLLSKNL